MMVALNDMSADSLRAISPAALSAYARAEGWTKLREYRRYSDIYVAEGKPEIVVPRTFKIADYAMSVSDLIRTFAIDADREETSVYYDLTVADRDVIRVSVNGDGSASLPVESGVALLNRSRDMVLAAAYSLDSSEKLYRISSSAEAGGYLKQLRLSHMEPGSSVLVLLSPVVPPVQQSAFPFVEVYSPMGRRVTERLRESLTAAYDAAEQVAIGNAGAFENTVEAGVSANLCEALAGLLDSTAHFQVGFTFAITRPAALNHAKVDFDSSHAEILRDAARNFRTAAPVYDARLFGFVHRLAREESEVLGAVRVRASVEGRVRSVSAVLSAGDYDRAIEAHRVNSAVTMEGDLERVGPRWRLHNARLVEMIDSSDDGEDY